jgi:hypothetical protein
MPNTFYWQGSTAGAGIARYDWNYGPNWRVIRPGAGSILNSPTSLTAPGASDVVWVGSIFTARSALLFGGYSGGVAGSTGTALWLNAQQTTGTTFNSSLAYFSATLLTPKSTTGTSLYPFPYLGGGLVADSEVYIWAVNIDNLDSATVTGITGARAELGLTLKVASNTQIKTTGQLNRNYAVGGVDGNGSPNYSVVDLKMVPSRHFNNGGTAACISTLYVSGDTNSSLFAGTPTVGLGNITINGGAFQSISLDNSVGVGATGTFGTATGPSATVARPFKVLLKNIVALQASVQNGDINVDKSCTFGTFTVKGGANPYYPRLSEETKEGSAGYNGQQINLAGTFNSTSASTLLGWAPGITSSAFVSGVFLYDQYTTAPTNNNYDYIPTILMGSPEDGATFTAQSVNVFNEVAPYSSNTSSNAQRPWRVEFFGDANITAMSVEGTTIAAWGDLEATKQVNISRLTMAENSVLDLRYAPEFNNWYFGSLTGDTVAGGINFADDTCNVLGSAGVRLYNTRIINNYDVRAAKVLPVVYEALDVSPVIFSGKK